MKPFPRWLTAGLSRSQWLALLCGVLAVAVLNLLLSVFAPPGAHAEIVADVIAALLAVVLSPYLLRTLDAMQRQVARQNSELRSLHAISGALTTRLDLAAILDIAVKEATRAVDGEMGALWLYDESNAQRVTHRVFYNISPAAQEAVGPQLETRDTEWVRQGRRPVRRTGLYDTWRTDRVADVLKLRSSMVVPLLREGAISGAFFLANRGGADGADGFTDDDESLLSAIAVTLSAAVQNARLYEESQRRGEVLRTLVARTGEAIAASSDAPRLMQILADEAARIVDCTSVAVYSLQGDGNYTLLAAHGAQMPFEETLHVPAALPPAAQPEQSPYASNVRAALNLSAPAPALDTPGYVFVLRARDQKGIGLLCLTDDVPRPGQPDRDAFAQALAAQAGAALESADLFANLQHAYARERRIAETFQRSLLPDIPLQMGAFEFAHKYQAALGEAVIGGDFYDLFSLPGGRVGLVMADVSGKGLKAAMQTAMVKYTLRAFARETPDAPGDALARVNTALCEDTGGHDGFVTLFYGILDTRTGDLAYASAGHEPPLCRHAGCVSPLPTEAGLPLGVFPGVPYQEGRAELAPGDLLLLFTDGLTEARADDGAFLGEDGLCQIVPIHEESAADAVETVYEGARAFAGGALHDDAAILLLRHLE